MCLSPPSKTKNVLVSTRPCAWIPSRGTTMVGPTNCFKLRFPLLIWRLFWNCKQRKEGDQGVLWSKDNKGGKKNEIQRKLQEARDVQHGWLPLVACPRCHPIPSCNKNFQIQIFWNIFSSSKRAQAWKTFKQTGVLKLELICQPRNQGRKQIQNFKRFPKSMQTWSLIKKVSETKIAWRQSN